MPSLSLSLLNARSPRLNFSLFVVVALLGLVFAPGRAAVAQTCSSSPCTISVPGTITATGTTGVVTSSATVTAGGTINNTAGSVSVELDGLATSEPGSAGWGLFFTNIILQGPGGTMVLLGGVGTSTDLSSQTITVADNGTTTLTALTTDTVNGHSYKPASFWKNASHAGSSVLPAGATTAVYPATDGSATLLNVFNGTTTDGTWKLYISNSGASFGALTNVTITGWKLTIAYSASAKDNTSTTISEDVAHQNLGSNVTLTATVTDTTHSGTVPTGSVTFKNDTNNSTISCATGSNLTLNGLGKATCIAAASTLGEGFSTVEADYGGGSSFITSTSATSPVIELIEGTTTNPSTNRYCNTGSATSPGGGGTGMVYPSIIKVPDLGNTVANLEVELNGVSTSNGGLRGSFLLVSPGSTHNLDFFDDTFNDTAVSGLNVDILDSASSYPNGTATATSGSYKPTDNYVLNSAFPGTSPSAHSIDSTIPDVVTTPTYSYPHGSVNNSLESAFSTATTAGDWALYFFRQDNGVQTLGSGWCLDFTLNTGTATTTAVASSKNGANTAHVGDSVTITATVTDHNGAVTGGTVAFTENGIAVAGTSGAAVAVNGSGTASITTTALTEGDHTIVANYSGDSGDNESSGQIIQRIDHVTTFSYNSGVISACNTGAIASTLQPTSTTDGTTGPFIQNPSNIFASKLPGTLQSLTLSLNHLTTGDESIYLTQAMVAGPNSMGLDFFSGTGNSSFGPFGPINVTLSDAASTQIPQSSYGAGTYKPADWNSTADTFYASASGFYPLPGTIVQAASHGASTFAGTFPNGMTSNGTWGLFFNITAKLLQESVANGWCLNFTENPVAVNATLGHSGNGIGGDFVQRETGASISVNIANPTSPAGQGSTGDPATTNPLTVADTFTTASGLSFNSGSTSGTDWTCTAAGTPQVVTCKNDDVVAQGSSYPALTIAVDVTATAPASYANSISVSGAGVAPTTANNTITIDPTPTLGLTIGHTGLFTQGSTAEWDVTVSNTVSGSRTQGTMTMTATLPTGYTLNGSSSTGTWGCGGAGNVITCTSTDLITGGSNEKIALTVNVPATSATSVTASAGVFGGNDPNHADSGHQATGSDTVTVIQVPATVALTTGNNQSAKINTAFTTSLEVTVLDAGGVAINSQSVTFTAPSTGATAFFSNSTTTITGNTNASGQISEAITSGNKKGVYSITVQAGAASNSFSLTNLVGPPFSMTVVSGNNQTTQILASFTIPLEVTVMDAGGNVISGQSVTFTAPSTGASALFSNSTATITANTDANGQLSEAVSSGSTAGAYSVSVTAGGASTNFGLTNLVGPPKSVSIVSGNSQSTQILTSFTIPLEVTVMDAGSNVISGQSVTFTAPFTGATAFFSNSTTTITGNTNASGQISEAVSAGSTAGGYSVTATAGTASINFSLANLVGPPKSVSVVSGNNQSTFDTAAFGSPLVVNVTDAGNNPLSGATVTFTPPSSGPTAIFAGGVNTATTDVTGTATSAVLAANNQVGGYTVSATSGTASTSFQLTNTLGPVMQLIVTAPNSAFTAVPMQFTVNALDAGNNLVTTDNDMLQFSSSDIAASLPPSGTLVNGTGTFAATLNTVPGPQTISATDTGNSIAGTSAGINVSTVPILVVNTAADDYGTALASNCSVQTTPGTTTNSDTCSLRDALLESASLGAAGISFDSTVITSATPINAASTLTIPAYTTINGPTSQVTVNGGGSGSNYPVFSVNAGVAGVTISNLTIVNGSSSSGGSGLTNAGTATITNCTFSGNQATGGGAAGAIENTGTLTITGCTFANNSATGGGNGGA
ncbi:MAG TPA: Ig-like domain repeat protein, partial [Terracidiphilus sp.]|nr:Ig-like domain repeat protein [Terracidiphilus sp.]